MAEEPPLTGDALTWKLHRENRADFRALKVDRWWMRALLLALLAAQLANLHISTDPTFHIPLP